MLSVDGLDAFIFFLAQESYTIVPSVHARGTGDLGESFCAEFVESKFHKDSTIGGGGDTTIPSPGRSQNNPFRG